MRSVFANTLRAPSLPAAAYLHPAALTDYTVHAAYGFDRLFAGFIGNTCRLKRASDSAEQDFGATSNGVFNRSAVDTWRSGADVDLVHFYDQTGVQPNLTRGVQAKVVVSNVWNTFGTDWSGTDGQLTRNQNGGVCCDLGDDVGHLYTSAMTMNTVGGFEMHMLWSPNERKRASGLVGSDPFGANATLEWLLSYGLNSSVHMSSRFSTAGEAYYFDGSASATAQFDVSAIRTLKKFSQQVTTLACTATELKYHDSSRKIKSVTLDANNQAGLAAGSLNNGVLAIGNYFASSSNSTLRTSSRANMMFGGIIITEPLTDLERFFILQKMQAAGQQHRLDTVANILGLFDEVITLKDINPSTGVATGRNGNATLEFNTATVAQGTPNWDFQYTIPNVGLQGVRSPTDNDANGFICNDATPPELNGTFVSAHVSNGATNLLYNTLAVASGSQFDSDIQQLSFSIGYDHEQPSIMCKMPETLDLDDVMGRRNDSTGAQTDYDAYNQAHGKYNRNTAHAEFLYGESVNINGTGLYTYTQAAWENTDGSAPLQFDAPVYRPLADNLANFEKENAFTLHIGTFAAPGGYNKSDPYATQKPLLLQSQNNSYINQGYMAGHFDGSIATNSRGGVVHHNTGAKIMSRHGLQASFVGTRVAFAWASSVLTQTEIEKVQVNFWKLLA